MRATLAARLPTTAARLAVKVVPMFSPRTMAKACSRLMTPDTRAARVNAVAAERTGSRPSAPRPTARTARCFPALSEVGQKGGEHSWAPSTAIWSFNRSKPMNSKANPKRCLQSAWGRGGRATTAARRVRPAERQVTQRKAPKDSTINQAVIVVPTLVPSSTPTDSRMVSSPAFTKLTSVTVTAELD